MAKKLFWTTAALTLLLMGAFNVAVRYAASTTNPRQLVAHMHHTPGTDCLALGNSLMAAGIDEETFRQASIARGKHLELLNAGLGASGPVEHLLLFRQAAAIHPHFKVVLYGFLDLQLSTMPLDSNENFIGNRAVMYYYDPGVVLGYGNLSMRDRILFQAFRALPMLADRGAVWAKVERLRRKMGAMGMPEVASNRFGRVEDFKELEPGSQADFIRECENVLASSPLFNGPVSEIIRESRAAGTKVVLVAMPMPRAHVQSFYSAPAWNRYLGRVRDVSCAQGASLLDASEWLEHDDASFADALHLNSQGAMKFSRQLAGWLAENKEASTCSAVAARHVPSPRMAPN